MNNNISFKNKRVKTNIWIIIFAIIIGIFYIIKIFSPAKKNNTLEKKSKLAEMLEILPHYESSLAYHEPNFYFMYKDSLYYYNRIGNSLYISNLDGSNQRLITSSDELSCASFYLAYKDEAYFYNLEALHTENKKYNKKINLITGEITQLNHDYSIKSRFFKDGTIIALGNLNLSDSSTFRKINLDTGKVELERKNEYNLNIYKYIYNYLNGNIYITNRKSNNYELYKNNRLINTFNVNNEYIDELLFVNDNLLLFKSSSSFYKLDIKTNIITKIEDFDYKIIESNSFNNAFVYNRNDNYIYEFSEGSFNKLFPIIPKEYDDEYFRSDLKIYDSGSKVILQYNANTLKYIAKIDRIGEVIIYDRTTQQTTVVNNVRRTFFDYENNIVYLYVKDGNTYTAEKIPLT